MACGVFVPQVFEGCVYLFEGGAVVVRRAYLVFVVKVTLPRTPLLDHLKNVPVLADGHILAVPQGLKIFKEHDRGPTTHRPTQLGGVLKALACCRGSGLICQLCIPALVDRNVKQL